MELDLSNQSLLIFQALSSETRLKIIYFLNNQKKALVKLPTIYKLVKLLQLGMYNKWKMLVSYPLREVLAKTATKKMVYLKIDDIHILFPKKIYPEFKLHSTDLKNGHFTDFAARPTCGLATEKNIVGKSDDPKYFLDSERVDAALLWFSEGFVEYKIPNLIQEDQSPELLEISFEIASEFPLSNNMWPSDIAIYVNDIKVATYTVPGNFSDTRGIYTPDWWNDRFSQYGLLKHLRINKLDTGIDGETYSDVTIDNLQLHESPFIKLKLEVAANAKNKGGLTLFGKGFGNHNQNISINTYYLDK